ncbi:phage portal protein [Rhodococcus sp. 14-2496-1d]|uniref:phage portal protein n=1 Tax=Rhodococcus sp. 14-2496-1d TaxID=2023146 RepID=UPI0015C65FC8|nr:phage portal protein [Rhodococcus sp. 14-2496-1d]
MDDRTARRYLDIGLERLKKQLPQWERRQRYYEGIQDDPFAPEGVNAEYASLQKQSIANWLGIAMKAPVQRMRADGIMGGDGKVDLEVWRNVIQPNHIDARQQIVFLQGQIHGRGIWSVSKNPANRDRPKIAVENSKRVWIEPDPADPFTGLFAVKTFSEELNPTTTSSLILPASVSETAGTLWVAYVYDDTNWRRFERRGVTGDWTIVRGGDHGLGELPFIASDMNVDADGIPHSAIEPLMPQQDAVNTIRFNTLLAMQFSAFRQRVFSGYDPVVRDSQGNAMIKRDSNGVPILDGNGFEQPMLRSPGKIGVDRALVFPGVDTKVYDLDESNLQNYISVYDDFLSSLFATGQVPPQYLLTRMANLSGDALTGAESTLKSLVAEMKRSAGEALESVVRLANVARGKVGKDDYSIEVIWGDTEAKSFAQIIDGVVKLIGQGFPKRAAFEMLPDATPPKVDGWMELVDQEREQQNEVAMAAMAALTPAPGPTDDGNAANDGG